jgi:hypothetical protein
MPFFDSNIILLAELILRTEGGYYVPVIVVEGSVY